MILGRRGELTEKVNELVAAARARRIRDAWAEAARRLGLEHRVAPKLFDDVLEGVLAGVPMRAAHLPLRDMRRLHMVVEASTLGTLVPELSMDGNALLDAFDRATNDDVPSSRRDGPPSSVYREAATATLDAEVRAWLRGAEGEAIGCTARDGKIVYQHGAPIEDAEALTSVLRALATLATTLSRAPLE